MAKFANYQFKSELFFRNSKGEDLVLEATDRNPNGLMLAVTGPDGKRDYLALSLTQAGDLLLELTVSIEAAIEITKINNNKKKGKN